MYIYIYIIYLYPNHLSVRAMGGVARRVKEVTNHRVDESVGGFALGGLQQPAAETTDHLHKNNTN